jgi:valyl-tRNA synthetase
LTGSDKVAADSTRHTLLYVLEQLLRLLHPLTPFVTEELWQQVAPRVGVEGDSISLQSYPTMLDVKQYFAEDYEQVEQDVEWFKQCVKALRRVRSELGVSPGKPVALLLQGGGANDKPRVTRFTSQLQSLLKLESITWLDGGEAPASAAAVVGELRLLVPLEGLVDLDAERTRLDKEIAKVASEREKSEAKLAKFSDKVPAAVVDQERARLVDWTSQLSALQEQRAKL